MDSDGDAEQHDPAAVPAPTHEPGRHRPGGRGRAARTRTVLGVLVAVVVPVLVVVLVVQRWPSGRGSHPLAAVRSGATPAVATATTGATSTHPVNPRPALPSASSGAVASSGPAPASSTAAIVVSRTQAIRAVLTKHATALLARNLAGFTATLDPSAAAFRKAQLAVFANTAAVPFASWFYDVDPVDVAAASTPAPGELLVAVTLRYALRGFDPQPTALREYYTFREEPRGWLLAGDTNDPADVAKGLVSARDLWDFGPVVVVRGQRSLVLAHPDANALAHTLAATADAAVPRVTAFWGNGWAGKVVILVPDSQDELRRIVGTSQDLSQIAALATAEITGSPGEASAVGDRVAINPVTFDTLGALGRRVVMTHEITHVATRTVTGTDSPTWLVEGTADYVGFKGTPTSLRFDAAELAHQVDAGQLPTRLPTAADFATDSASAPALSVDYEEAWLACKFIVSRTNEATLIAFYRQVGTSTASPASALATAFAQVLHTDQATFTRSWSAYVGASLK